MFQLHGWAEVLGTTTGEEDYAELKRVVASIRARIVEIGLDDRVEVVGRGGSFVLRVNLVQNRKRGDLELCRGLLAEIGERAVGSYGIFYVRDDEYNDVFQRLVLRRGVVKLEKDDILSPIVPTIEDP
jgi:hypothetical protein